MSAPRPAPGGEASGRRRDVRSIAVFEAAKGALVLLVGFGLLAFVHRDLQSLGESLVAHAHLNPASGSPRIFLEALATLDATRHGLLAAGAAAYSALRFAEAWGLWHGRAWAEWLGVVSGGLYLPIEIVELVQGVSVLKLATFAANLVIVAVLARALRRSRRARDDAGASPGM